MHVTVDSFAHRWKKFRTLLWFNIVAHRCFNAHLLCQAPKSGGPGSFGSKKQTCKASRWKQSLHGHALLKTTCLQVKFFANGETSKSFDLIWFIYYTSHTSQGLCDILRWDAAHAAHGRGKRKENKGKANQERGESWWVSESERRQVSFRADEQHFRNKKGSSPNITRELNQKHLLSRSRRAWEISLWAPVSPSIESPEFFQKKKH